VHRVADIARQLTNDELKGDLIRAISS